MQLVAAPGGTGKTRLGLRLARDCLEMGFRTWWPPAGATLGAARAAIGSGEPALIVVDYAETRVDLSGMLAEVLARQDGPPLRVLLLASSAGNGGSS